MDWLTADHIAEFAVLITALAAAIVSIRTSRKSAHKDEVDLLREEIRRLQERVDTAEKQLVRELEYKIKLLRYIGDLQRIMRQAGLAAPPVPEQEQEESEVKK